MGKATQPAPTGKAQPEMIAGGTEEPCHWPT
jgi:hypothetical protein